MTGTPSGGCVLLRRREKTRPLGQALPPESVRARALARLDLKDFTAQLEPMRREAPSSTAYR